MVGFVEMQQLCCISHFVLYLTQTGEGQGTIGREAPGCQPGTRGGMSGDRGFKQVTQSVLHISYIEVTVTNSLGTAVRMISEFISSSNVQFSPAGSLPHRVFPENR